MIWFKASQSKVQMAGFVDSDYASCPDTRRSTRAYYVFLGGCLIWSSSKKQSIVTRSSTEAEYRALAHISAEIVWLKSVLTEIGITLSYCLVIWCDNQGAALRALNPVNHARTKHIEIDQHLVRNGA